MVGDKIETRLSRDGTCQRVGLSGVRQLSADVIFVKKENAILSSASVAISWLSDRCTVESDVGCSGCMPRAYTQYGHLFLFW